VTSPACQPLGQRWDFRSADRPSVADNIVPVSSQAAALLQLYPAANLDGKLAVQLPGPVLTSTHRDALQLTSTRRWGGKMKVWKFQFSEKPGEHRDCSVS